MKERQCREIKGKRDEVFRDKSNKEREGGSEREAKSETGVFVPTFRMFFHPLWSFHVLGLLPLCTGKRKWRHKKGLVSNFMIAVGSTLGLNPKGSNLLTTKNLQQHNHYKK